MKRRLLCHTVLALGATVLATSARGADHVTLRNGFDLVCDHQSAEGDRLRLYLDADSTSYIDVDPAEIVAIETLPAALPMAAPASMPPSTRSASLTPSELHELLASAGEQHTLDVDLLAAVVHAPGPWG